jgi:HEAT repeat protein
MRSTFLTLAILLAWTLPHAARAQQAEAQPPSLSQADFAKLTEALRAEPQRAMKVRLQAALILGRSGGEAAIGPLGDCLSDDPEYPVRAACALALGNVNDIHAIEPLVARLEDPEELVRNESRTALFRYTRPEAIPYLQAARERGSARVRLVLVELAAKINDPQAGMVLAELMGDPDEKVRDQSSAVLKTMDSPQVTALLFKALEHPNYRVKAQAARLMGERKQVQAVDRLVELASSPLEAVEVQVAARQALGEMRLLLDVNKLSAQARDGSLEKKDRARALTLLSTIGGPDARQACQDVLNEGDESMRISAAQALADMGDPRALPALRDALGKASNDRVARMLKISIHKLERGSAP